MKKQVLTSFLLLLFLAFGASNLNAQYCTSGATSAADDDISRVAITGAFSTGFNNISACYGTVPQYQDFTITVPAVSLLPGSTYTVTVELTQCSGFFYPNSCNIWIDYNRNQTFDAAELLGNIVGGPGFPSLHTLNFTVPAGTPLGLTRMRLVQVEGGNTASIMPCGTYTWGETEDYTVNIVSASGGGGPVLPPIANFFPSQPSTATAPTDTVWINSPYELVATSTNTSRNFWDIQGENPLLPGYVRNNVAWTAQQYIDTAKYDSRFRYTYNRRGFWPIRLLA
ncbi:MAG: hypothetical protein FGM41_08385, partial [Bacteroidetes bacterium]|nr:hypothetical protein [Bacteroidota bacterium]